MPRIRTYKKSILLVLMASFLFSCSLPVRPLEPIVQNSLEMNVPTFSDLRTPSFNNCYFDDDYSLPNIANITSLPGFVIVSSPEGTFNAVSLLTGKTIFKTDYQSIEMIDGGENGTYLRCYLPWGESLLFDYRGYQTSIDIIPKNAVVTVDSYSDYFDYGAKKRLIEVISVNDLVSYKEVLSDGKRTMLHSEPDLMKQVGGRFIPCEGTLERLGINNFSCEITESGLFSVKGPNVSFSFIVSKTDKSAFFHKAYVRQEIKETEGNDYSFIRDGKRYSSNLVQLQLATGKEVEIPFNYIIDSFRPIYGENGKKECAVISASPIVNKEVSPDKVKLLVDANGLVHNDVSDNFLFDEDAFYLYWNRLYAPKSGTVFNHNLEVIDKEIKLVDFTVHSSVFSFSKGGKIGLKTYDGLLLSEAIFDEIGFLFTTNGYGVGRIGTDYYNLNLKDGSSTPISYLKGGKASIVGGASFRVEEVEEDTTVVTYRSSDNKQVDKYVGYNCSASFSYVTYWDHFWVDILGKLNSPNSQSIIRTFFGS